MMMKLNEPRYGTQGSLSVSMCWRSFSELLWSEKSSASRSMSWESFLGTAFHVFCSRKMGALRRAEMTDHMVCRLLSSWSFLAMRMKCETTSARDRTLVSLRISWTAQKLTWLKCRVMATTLGAISNLLLLDHPQEVNSSGWILAKIGTTSSVSCPATFSALTCKKIQ